MSSGQTLTLTNNNPVTRIAQPGQSGHTVWGFETSIPTRVGTRYDNAIVVHTTSNVERESKYGSLLKMRLLKFVIRASPPIVKHSRLTHRSKHALAPFGCVIADRPSIYFA
jgi:hypothetical protein